MKTPKTNIYLSYFREPNTILTPAQKRRVVIFMTFAGLFVLDTIIGFPLTVLYALIGMVSVSVAASLFLTEGDCFSEADSFNEEDDITDQIAH